MIISASAGASTPLVSPRTIGTGSPRKVATRPNSSPPMRTDGEAHRQFLAAIDAGDIGLLEVGGLRKIGAHGAAVAQHEPAAADIAASGCGIDAVVDGG